MNDVGCKVDWYCLSLLLKAMRKCCKKKTKSLLATYRSKTSVKKSAVKKMAQVCPPFCTPKKMKICSNYANSCRSLCGQSSRSEAERVHWVWTIEFLPKRELLRNNVFVWNKNQSFQTSAFTTTTNRPPPTKNHPIYSIIYFDAFFEDPKTHDNLAPISFAPKVSNSLCWLYQANCKLEILRRTKKEIEAHWSFRASLPLL